MWSIPGILLFHLEKMVKGGSKVKVIYRHYKPYWFSEICRWKKIKTSKTPHKMRTPYMTWHQRMSAHNVHGVEIKKIRQKNQFNKRHSFWSLLKICINMKWIQLVFRKIQSGNDSVYRQADKRMKGKSEIANMPKFNNNILENSQNLSEWLETKHNSKGGGGTLSLATLM